MTTAVTSTSLTISRVVKADPTTVFRAWTEPEQLGRWSAPEVMDVEAEVDLSIGGGYRLRMTNADGEHHNAVGVYREIDPPRLLSYTWRWEEAENDVGETVVTVQFNDLGGSTEVVLTHERFPNEEAVAAHNTGWASCLSRLDGVFAG